MRARLLILGCFTHDSQRVLTAVRELALVHAEPLLNIVLGRFDRHQTAGELRVAILTDAEQGMVTHEFKFSLCHVSSLRRSFRRSSPVEIKRHHYRKCAEAVSQPLNLEASKGAVFHMDVDTKIAAPSFIQKDVEEGVVNPNLTVIFDEAQFSEAIHEKTHARPGCADHLRQYLLADLRNYRLRLAFLAELRQQ
jgi:hypothetical protein